MNSKTLLLGSIAVLVAGLGLAACDAGSQEPAPTSEGTARTIEDPVAPEAAPAQSVEHDTKRLLARAAERWDHITHADWIQAYDFFTPERKQSESLSHYLQGKEHHDYRDPSKPRLLRVDGDTAFVALEVVWTPLTPTLLDADNLPPEGMTEVIPLVETWTWQNGEWFWSEVTRQSDFVRDHPDLARDAKPSEVASSPANPAAPADPEKKQ